MELLSNCRVEEGDIRRYVQSLISRSIMVQHNEDSFVKVLHME